MLEVIVPSLNDRFNFKKTKNKANIKIKSYVYYKRNFNYLWAKDQKGIQNF